MRAISTMCIARHGASWFIPPVPTIRICNGMCNRWTDGLSATPAVLKQLLGVNRYGNHWNQYYADGTAGRFACVNAFIGKLADGSIATVQTLPWDMLPWGVGSGSAGSYNDTHVQFEVCEDDLTRRTYYEQAMTEAAELCAYLCEQYGISTRNVVSHHEAYLAGMGSNHGDIDAWLSKFGETMDDFRARVENARLNIKENAPMTTEEKQAFHQLQAQFAEQKTQIESQQKRIADLEEQVKVKWNYIDKNLPSLRRLINYIIETSYKETATGYN